MSHRSLPIAYFLLCTLAAAVPSQGATVPPPGAESAWKGLMERARVPGMSIAVIEEGKVVSTVALGVASSETGESVGEGTLFEAASLSKPVFATVVLRLAARGDLDLDRPLHELLPSERISHDPRSRELTARLVLSHRTGLPNWGPEKLDFAFDPGERFGYSGEGYVYLQRVIEEVMGTGLDELVRREVFEPLGMRRSRFSWPRGEPPALALPHDEVGRPQPKRPAHEANAAASLHTTGAEYARFVVAWMEGGLLPPETVAAALEPAVRMRADAPETDTPPEIWRRIAWGLGWGLQLPADGDGDPIVWHWGDNGPAKAFVAFRPASREGVVYFANGSNGLAIGRTLVAGVVGDMEPAFAWAGYEDVATPGFEERLAGLAAEADGRYRDAIEHHREALATDPEDADTERRIDWLGDLIRVRESPVRLPAETLARYAGSYGPRRLAVGEDGLVYRRGENPEHRLVPLSPTLFALEGMVEFRLEVVVDEEGRPEKVVGHYLDGDSDEHPRDPAGG